MQNPLLFIMKFFGNRIGMRNLIIVFVLWTIMTFILSCSNHFSYTHQQCTANNVANESHATASEELNIHDDIDLCKCDNETTDSDSGSYTVEKSSAESELNELSYDEIRISSSPGINNSYNERELGKLEESFDESNEPDEDFERIANLFECSDESSVEDDQMTCQNEISVGDKQANHNNSSFRANKIKEYLKKALLIVSLPFRYVFIFFMWLKEKFNLFKNEEKVSQEDYNDMFILWERAEQNLIRTKRKYANLRKRLNSLKKVVLMQYGILLEHKDMAKTSKQYELQQQSFARIQADADTKDEDTETVVKTLVADAGGNISKQLSNLGMNNFLVLKIGQLANDELKIINDLQEPRKKIAKDNLLKKVSHLFDACSMRLVDRIYSIDKQYNYKDADLLYRKILKDAGFDETETLEIIRNANKHYHPDIVSSYIARRLEQNLEKIRLRCIYLLCQYLEGNIFS